MAGDDGGGLHDFVAGRYAELRRSAFLMCGDWALADELTQKSLARLVGESRRTKVEDPDAFVYSHLMASFQRRRSSGRQHLFVAAPRETPDTPPSDAAASSAISEAAQPAAQEAETTPPAGGTPRHRSRGVSTTEKPQTRKIEDLGAVAGQSVERDAEGAGGPVSVGAGDPIRTILVVDALHKLAPRCRAVLVLRHWDGFAVDETADMLGLADERVDAYEAAGLAALDYLLAEQAR